MTELSWHEILLRLLVALVFSGGVGLQRYLVGKAAGVRTHALVGVGAALFTLISTLAFPTAASNADRIASQVVTGIGFIGGGAILKEGATIRGLTTAAGLWAAAALGMAAGAGLYVTGLLGALVILATLLVLRRLELYLPQHLFNVWSIQATLAEGTTVDGLRQVISAHCKTVTLEALVYESDTKATFAAELPHDASIDLLVQLLRSAGARTISCVAVESGSSERGA